MAKDFIHSGQNSGGKWNEIFNPPTVKDAENQFSFIQSSDNELLQ